MIVIPFNYKFIKLFVCSTQLSTISKLLINAEIAKIGIYFSF